MFENHHLEKNRSYQLMIFMLVFLILTSAYFVFSYEIFSIPTHNNPTLNFSSISNLTTDNLTAFNLSTSDVDGDPLKNIYNWYKNGASLTLVNMPFEGGALAESNTTIRDYSHFAKNGSLEDALYNATGGYDGFGAYEFNDLNDAINLGNHLEHNPNNAGLTIAFWLYPLHMEGNKAFLGKWDGSQGFVHLTSTVGKSFFKMNNGSQTISIGGSTVLFDLEEWIHIAVVYSPDHGQLRYFENGTLISYSNITALSNITANNNLTIGHIYTDSNIYWSFNGTIDEFLIYNVSLTNEQILALYENKSNFMHSTMIGTKGETWNVSVTPNDGTADGITKWTNTVSVSNNLPEAINCFINSSNKFNYSNSSLTFSYLFNDSDSQDSEIDKEIWWWTDGSLNKTFSNLTFIDVGNLTKNTYWNVSVRVYDGTNWSAWCNNITHKIENTPPVHSIPILNASKMTNYTNEEIKAYNISTKDFDSDLITNIFNWFLNGFSLEYLILPFDKNETNVASNNLRDYASNLTILLGGTNSSRIPRWTRNGISGGAYAFDGVDDYILVNDTFSYYGVPWNGDGLTNLEIGKQTGRLVSFRFRAEHTGNAHNLTMFFMNASGYMAGTGGKVRVELREDDGSQNHFPSDTILTYVNISNPADLLFPNKVFHQTASLEKEKIYHLVFINYDSDPISNYISIDNLLNSANSNGMQPAKESDNDFALIWKPSSTDIWRINYRHTPIFAIYYDDGFVQGQGYRDVWKSSNETIQGNREVRQTFTVSSETITIQSVAVRLKKEGNPGDLNITLEFSNGTKLDSIIIPASSISSSYNWISGKFSLPQTLVSGKSYNLVLSAPAGDPYRIYPIQEGTSNLFKGGTFKDGYAQYYNGTAWVNFRSSTAGDLQFYFVVQEKKLDFNNSLTMEAWVYMNTTTNNSINTIIGKYNEIGDQRAYILGTDNIGRLKFSLCQGNSSTCSSLVADSNLSFNIWHYVVATYNGNEMKLYQDAILLKKNSYSSGIYKGTDNFIIGGLEKTNYTFNGTIDEVRIYNYSLSHGQIQTNFNLGTPRYNVINQTETDVGQVWSVNVTPVDENDDGVTLSSGSLTVLDYILTPLVTSAPSSTSGGGMVTNEEPIIDIVNEFLPFINFNLDLIDNKLKNDRFLPIKFSIGKLDEPAEAEIIYQLKNSEGNIIFETTETKTIFSEEELLAELDLGGPLEQGTYKLYVKVEVGETTFADTLTFEINEDLSITEVVKENFFKKYWWFLIILFSFIMILLWLYKDSFWKI